MPLADLLANGSNAYVAHLRQLGFGPVEILARLRDRFRGEDDRSLIAALNRGDRAYNAGGFLSQNTPDIRLLASQVPGGPCEGPNWQYTVQATLQDVGSGTQTVRTFTVVAGKSRSYNELAGDTLAAAEAYYASPNRGNGTSEPRSGFIVSGLTTLAVERTC